MKTENILNLKQTIKFKNENVILLQIFNLFQTFWNINFSICNIWKYKNEFISKPFDVKI